MNIGSSRGREEEAPAVYMIMGGPTEGDSNRAQNVRLNSIKEWDERKEVQSIFQDVIVEFGKEDVVHIQRPQTDALVIRAEIGGYNIEGVFVDTCRSVDIMFMDCFKKMNSMGDILPVGTSPFVFAVESVRVYGKVKLPMVLGEENGNRVEPLLSCWSIPLPHIMSYWEDLHWVRMLRLPHRPILMMKFHVEDEDKR